MIGDPPQPKDPEIVAVEGICEEMRIIARELPKPESIEGKKEIAEFGNNFFILFEELIRQETPNFVDKGYLRKAKEKYGEKWKKFLEDNADLITQIKEVLKQKEIHEELMKCYKNLIFNSAKRHDFSLLGSIEQEIDLDGFRFDILKKLNPLLKQASEAMVLCGIKPEDFYG